MSKLIDMDKEEVENMIKEFPENEKKAVRLLYSFLVEQEFVFDMSAKTKTPPSVVLAALQLVLETYAKKFKSEGFDIASVMRDALAQSEKNRTKSEGDTMKFNFGVEVSNN